MKVSFYLKRPKSDTDTAIYARISYNGFQLKYYLPETIHPSNWSTKTQRAKQTLRFTNYREFNLHLDNIKNSIENVFRTYLNDKSIIPLPNTLKELLDIKIKNVESDTEKNFFKYFDQIIEQSEKGIRTNPKTAKPIARSTIQTYKTIRGHLNEYQKTQRRKIDFKTIDLDFYDGYTEYLMSKLLANNTIGKHFQIIKMVLNDAYERGVEVNTAYRSKKFKVLREDSDDIYLTESEIDQIYELDLSQRPNYEVVRDLFIIGCKTGLRFSDYSDLQVKNLTNDGYLERKQNKTKDGVVIPIHPRVKEILKKYNGEFPASISSQKTNDYLKEICKMVTDLHVKVTKEESKGGATITTTFKKYKMVSSHTARRSFATNEYLARTSAQTIMKITGHKTERAFMKYIKLSTREHAKVLQLSWDKRLAANAQ